MPVAISTQLDEAGSALWNDINACLFTPFLGAGASSLRPEKIKVKSAPWKHVVETLAAVRCQLNTDSSIRYLRSFAVQRLRVPPEVLDGCLPLGRKPAVPSKLKSNGLVLLQAELVRSTVRLTRYFGEHFTEEAPSVHNLEECHVTFSTNDLPGSDAFKALIAAVDIAAELIAKRRFDSPFLLEFEDVERSLRIQRVYEKLLSLVTSLIPKEEVERLKEHRKHRNALKALPPEMKPTGASDRGLLRLDSVQWLSDLLWYTLRYWLPLYPTTAELAFELSLEVRDAPAKRAELAQTAQALENESADLVGILSDLLGYCERGLKDERKGNQGTEAFYCSIAAIMRHQYEMYCSGCKVEETADYWPEGEEADGGEERKEKDERSGMLQPLILTTNFDRGLENALARFDISHHVLFPARLGRKSPVEWLLRTYLDKKSREKKGLLFEDLTWLEACSQGEEPTFEIVGPIIIKLHGAPCEPPGTRFPFRHWVVLSELGYLQALEESRQLPWITQQLDSPSMGREDSAHRSLWFLGHSIADWNVRLRLYRDSYSREGRVRQGRRSTVDRDRDVFRYAILRNLEVVRYVGDLTRLPGIIQRVLDDHRLKTSEGVDEMVGELKSLLESKEG